MKIMKNTNLYSTKLFLYSHKLFKLKFIIFQVWKLKHNYIILNILEVKVAQSHPTLCDPMDYTVHGILQARILEWVAFPFSKGIFPTQGSNPGLPHCRHILYHLSHQGSLDATKTSIFILRFRSPHRENFIGHLVVRTSQVGKCSGLRQTDSAESTGKHTLLSKV